MPVKLRLQRGGRKKHPVYSIVVADSRSPRDGRFIEKIGQYDPTRVPAAITLDFDKALQWLGNGAQPTDTVNAILRYEGVLYKKHLLGGVKKGAFTLEQAEEKFEAWLKTKNVSKYEAAKAHREKKEAEWAKLNAKVEAPVKVEEPVAEAEEAPADEAEVAETEAPEAATDGEANA